MDSRPAAPARLYLDFNGAGASTWGGYAVPETPAYDRDGDPTTFTEGELSAMRQIWARVAEKYAPFNLDVTTVDPGVYPPGEVLRVVVGGGGAWAGGTFGGMSYVGSFTGELNTAWVFPANLGGGDPVYTAEAVAHEAGHGFGLQHQSTYSGTTKTAEYNIGDSLRAPVMGTSYYAQRGVWWYGTNSVSSSAIQDDLARIGSTSNGFGYRPDDAGGTATTSAAMRVSGNALSKSGVIEQTSDADWLQFKTAGGAVSFRASVGAYVRAQSGITGAGDASGATLDLMLEVRDASGGLIASADSATLGGAISAEGLAAGTYYLVVKSHGSYGDVGTYDVVGTAEPLDPPPPPGTPTADAGGPYSVGEGGTLVLDGTASTFFDGRAGTVGLTYAWDLDGDGVFGEVGVVAGRGSETGSNPTFSAAGLDGPSTYTIGLKVTDTSTGQTSPAVTSNISILNVAPVPSINGLPEGPSGTYPEGAPISLSASATDAGAADTITFTWGVFKDHFPYANGTGASFSFTPNDNGTYTVFLTASDDDGGSTTVMRIISVANAAPVATIDGVPAAGKEGVAVLLKALVTDAGSLDTFTYTWGVKKDGVPYATSSAAAFSFTPDDDGLYAVTLTVTDKDGGASTISATIPVANVAPTLHLSGTYYGPRGEAYALTFSSTDPGADTVRSWRVDWGDGRVEDVSAASGWVSHTYAAGGRYAIAAWAADEDGTFAADTAPVVSVDSMRDTVAPTASLVMTGPVTAGATVQTFTVGYGDDVRIDESSFGDGDVIVTGPNGFNQSAKFVSYAVQVEDGRRVVTYASIPPEGAWSDAANGTYVIRLADARVADAAGNYVASGTLGSFVVNLPPAGPLRNAAVDFGNIAAVSQQPRTMRGALSEGDSDGYHRLRVGQAGTLDVRLTGLSADAQLALLDAAGHEVGVSSNRGMIDEEIREAVKAGTYYVRVFSERRIRTPCTVSVSAIRTTSAKPILVAPPLHPKATEADG